MPTTLRRARRSTAALTQWTADFNAGRADKVCDLFSRELRVDFRGLPERGYDAQCDLLKQALTDGARTFSNAFAIKEILVWGDIAVVRLTWTLDDPAEGRPRDHGGRARPRRLPQGEGRPLADRAVYGVRAVARYFLP